MLADWVTRGELNDPVGELFIKANERKNGAKSAKQQWAERFIYRTVNLKELMQQDGFFVGDGKLVEISIPIFLRPLMSEILSTGKSLRIIRYLES